MTDAHVLCKSCEVREAQPLHTCPYKEEINDDTTSLCGCCEDCKQECCWDI